MLSIYEVTESFSADLPNWQFKANLAFVEGVHASLKDGGVWMSPALGKMYARAGGGFVELEAGMPARIDDPEIT